MSNIALKEWSIINDALADGSLSLLLRKGGIFETGGPGAFDVEHPQFILYPTWAHQKTEMIKPHLRDKINIHPEPDQIPLQYAAEVAHVWQTDNRQTFDQLDHLHPWSTPQIDMRFNYRPNNPLFLIAVRVAKLTNPITIPNRDSYGGCKSWVELHPDDTPTFPNFNSPQTQTAISEQALQSLITQVTNTLEA